MKFYTLYSGGARGADLLWSQYAPENLIDIIHIGYKGAYLPYVNQYLEDEQLKEWFEMLPIVDQYFFDRGHINFKNRLLARNYYQIKDSQVVYAIWEILKVGECFSDLENDSRICKKEMVKGGTGYTIWFAILKKIPIYVFDLRTYSWKIWNYRSEKFVQASTPIIQGRKFTCIGTRDIPDRKRDNIKWSRLATQINKVFESLK